MLVMSVGVFVTLPIYSQAVIPATGGGASGTGGSVAYTTGQTAFNAFSGINGFIIQGVQQPYEISTLTAIENAGDIMLEYSVYPNPASKGIKLIIGSFSGGSCKYQIYSLTGVIIKEHEITGPATTIPLSDVSAGILFLRVIRDNHEVKVFKIVKR